jgi:hypothetical protein
MIAPLLKRRSDQGVDYDQSRVAIKKGKKEREGERLNG